MRRPTQLSDPTPAHRRFAAVALATGLLAAVALPHTRLGLGMVLVAAMLLAGVVLSGAFSRTRFTVLMLVLAAALASVPLFRDASWLLWVDLTAAAVVLVAAAGRSRTWPALARAAHVCLANAVPGSLAVPWLAGLRPSAESRQRLVPVVRGLALGVVLVLVFGTLFAAADEAFDRLSDSVLTPDVNLGLIPARVGVAIATVAMSGAVVLTALAPPSPGMPRDRPDRWSPEWVIALVSLNALFVAFLAVQVDVLFGGKDHVEQTTGLTYAHYAREGFYQLLAVAFLILAVVAVAGRRHGERSSARRPTPVEALLGLLCVLTLTVLVSAVRRLGLLEDAYGFTLTRLFGHAGTLWVGAVLIWVVVTGALRRTDMLPRAVLATTAAGLLVFSAVNPEGLVARENVDRFERTGKIDTRYLRTLGADAAPALSRLPRSRRRDIELSAPANDGVFGWNLARVRAREATAAR